MTLKQMAAAVMQAWTTEHRQTVALWDKKALMEEAMAVAEKAMDEAQSVQISEREALMQMLGVYPSPPPPPGTDKD